jgi:hypothetical protein
VYATFQNCHHKGISTASNWWKVDYIGISSIMEGALVSFSLILDVDLPFQLTIATFITTICGVSQCLIHHHTGSVNLTMILLNFLFTVKIVLSE